MQIVVDDIVVSYGDTNQEAKDVILFLHGWGSSKETFKDLIAPMSKKHRCISLDYPGFGETQAPQVAWGIPEYADFVMAFLAKLKCSPKVIVGHSMGGRIAVHLAGSGHMQDAKLVLLGAAGFKESASLKNQAFKAIAKGGKLATKPLPGRVQNKLKSKLYGAAGSTDYLESGNMKETFSKVINLDLTEYAAKVSNETLLIYGENDDQTPPEYGKRYNTLMENSSFHQISDSGHYVHLDSAAQVQRLMKEFIG